MNDINYVLSYINPDTDGIACSIAMANLLSLEGEKWIPGAFGAIGEETLFVLKSLGISIPEVKIDLKKAIKIVLVDTHHKAQLPKDFPYDKVVAIFDHHPNGNDDLFPSANITNRKIGAAASIVAELYLKRDIINVPMLRLLAFAILSNTLNFSAPSSTEFDHNIFEWICRIAPIEPEIVDRMFEQRSLVLKKDLYTALCTDFKIFDTKSGRVGISQLEVYDLEKLIDISGCIDALQRIASENNIGLCLFNGVDIKSRRSVVVAANNQTQELVKSLFDLDGCRKFQVFNRILLRKTDFVPQLNQEEAG